MPDEPLSTPPEASAIAAEALRDELVKLETAGMVGGAAWQETMRQLLAEFSRAHADDLKGKVMVHPVLWPDMDTESRTQLVLHTAIREFAADGHDFDGKRLSVTAAITKAGNGGVQPALQRLGAVASLTCKSGSVPGVDAVKQAPGTRHLARDADGFVGQLPDAWAKAVREMRQPHGASAERSSVARAGGAGFTAASVPLLPDVRTEPDTPAGHGNVVDLAARRRGGFQPK